MDIQTQVRRYVLSTAVLQEQLIECCCEPGEGPPPPPPEADLTITATAALAANVFEAVRCGIDVINHGPNVARNVVVKSTVSADQGARITDLNSFTPPGVWGNPAASPLVATLGDLPPNGTMHLEFIVQCDSSGSFTLTHDTSVASDTPDPNTVDNTSTAQVFVGVIG